MPKKINAFAKFLFEQKALYPEKSMGEVQLIAGEKWQNMSASEREPYKTGENNKVVDTRVKYNCLGVSINDEEKRLEEKRAAKMREIDFVDNIISTALLNSNLLNEVFYFFCASYYVKKIHDDIYPAEIALAKFSLSEGVTNVFHMLINPGVLPMGMAATALYHSKQNHRLPLPPNTFGESNYHKILDEILNFLEVKELSSTCVPPFYVFDDFQGDDYEAAKLTLEKIAFENKCNNGFRVLKAEQLLFSMNRQVLAHFRRDQVPFKSLIHAKDAMRHDNNRYCNIGCEIHNNEDHSEACTLSKVKRWGYLMVEHCGLDIEMIPGQHYPIRNINKGDNFEEEDEEDDDEDNLESCVTESFHKLQINESNLSSVDSRSTLNDVPVNNLSIRLFNPMKSQLSLSGTLRTLDSFESQTDISNKASFHYFSSMRSFTNIDESVKNYEESWTKTIVQSHLDDDDDDDDD